MALADYYLCDVCECKTFYDANLPHGETDTEAYRPKKPWWPDGDVGAMVVLCKGCAETHRVVIEKKQRSEDDGD